MPVEVPPPGPELGAWLAENREPLIRRWLELVVERSSLEQLAERPLAERVRELDLLLEAARGQGSEHGGPLGRDAADTCRAAIAQGEPFALLLLAPPPTGPPADVWTDAVRETARRDARVAVASGGLTAIVLPAADEARVRVEADRIRAGAWQLVGGECLLPDVGIALHPADGDDPAALAEAARARLPERVPIAPLGVPADEPEPAPGDVRIRRAAAAGEEPRDLWRQLSERRRRQDHVDGPPADVTPLYPPRPE